MTSHRRAAFRLTALCLLAASAAPLAAEPLRNAVSAEMPSLMAIYRDLHEHPELSFQEVRSAKVMADAARAAGFEVTCLLQGLGQNVAVDDIYVSHVDDAIAKL